MVRMRDLTTSSFTTEQHMRAVAYVVFPVVILYHPMATSILLLYLAVHNFTCAVHSRAGRTHDRDTFNIPWPQNAARHLCISGTDASNST